MLLAITNETINEIILESRKNVIIYFYSKLDASCMRMLPIVEEISNEFGDEILFGKVNVVGSEDIAIKYHIITIPNLIFLSNGEKIGSSVGSKSKKGCVEWIEKMREA